jgi:hypothetical protein
MWLRVKYNTLCDSTIPDVLSRLRQHVLPLFETCLSGELGSGPPVPNPPYIFQFPIMEGGLYLAVLFNHRQISSNFSLREDGMRLRQTCASIMIIGGMLLCSNGAARADQSSSGIFFVGGMGSGSESGSKDTVGSSGGKKSHQEQGRELPRKSEGEAQGRTGGETTTPDLSKITPGKQPSGGNSRSNSGSTGSSGETGATGGMGGGSGSSGGSGSGGGGQ